MARDGPRSCGQAVDLWALGVLLYEMVTGEARRGTTCSEVVRGVFFYAARVFVLVGAVVPQGGEGAAAQDRAHEAEAAVVDRKRDAVAAQGPATPTEPRARRTSA